MFERTAHTVKTPNRDKDMLLLMMMIIMGKVNKLKVTIIAASCLMYAVKSLFVCNGNKKMLHLQGAPLVESSRVVSCRLLPV